MAPTRLLQRGGRRAVAMLLAGFTVAAVTGCADKESTSGTDGGGETKKEFVIGLAEALTTNPFLSVMDKAFTDEATKRGMKVEVLNGEYDNAKQSANVDTLVAKKVDLIVIVSSSPTAIIPALKRANEAKIPVIALNAQIDPGADLVTYVGASDFQFGQGLGNLLVKAAPDGGKVAVVTGPEGAVPSVKRLDGIKDVLKSKSAFEIVAALPADWKDDKALAVTQDLLTKHPKGTLTAIVGQGPEIRVGAEWAKKNGREEVVFIAGDYNKDVEAAIKDGTLYGTVNQSPITQGKLAAEYAYYWLTGEKAKVPQPEYNIPLPAITKENVDANPADWG